MAGDSEKAIEHSGYVESAEKRDGSDVSTDGDLGQLKTLDTGGLNKEEVLTELPAAEEKRILRKIDFRLVPLLTFLYLVAFIDRSNSMSRRYFNW